MNVTEAIQKRRLGMRRRIDIDFAVDRIRLKEAIKLEFEPNPADEDYKTNGPLACATVNKRVIAVANEDGHIDLLQKSQLKSTAHWLGHENAIFDLKTSPDQKTILTASGDTTIKQWDIETKKELTTLKPHHSSVKSISVYDPHTIASGSRDGTIQVHDIRSKTPTMIVIRDAHRNNAISKTRKVISKTDPISCVTNVVFDPCFPRIYSTGANDATIKLWDLRKQTQRNKPRRTIDGTTLVNEPYACIHHPRKGMHCGYSHLLISSCKIYAACSDNKIYCYNGFESHDEPIKFTGYSYDTYLRLAILDDRFLISGAKRSGAIMWSLSNKSSSKYYPETTKQPIGQLKPDDNDMNDTNVIETDWDSLSIFTFRDDRLVCKWSMQHVSENERAKLACDPNLAPMSNHDVSIQMSDIIDVNVLRPNHRVNNTQDLSQTQRSRIS